MKELRGRVAAITGAGSGIGRALALRLAQEGCRLALSDVDEAGLDETVALCRAAGAEVHAARVDVADREAVHAWADEVAAHFGAVHVVVNNAGVGMGGTVEDTRYEDLEWLLAIDFWGVVHGTRAFLPHLRASGEGHVVNVSSVFGLLAIPTQSAYNAAKFAVRGFTESLRQELLYEGARIGVTSVHPGGIRTNIARRARLVHRDGWIDEHSGSDFEKLLATTPEHAAARIVGAIRSGRPRLLIGRDAHLLDLVQRLLPSSYQRLVVAAFRRSRDRARVRR